MQSKTIAPEYSFRFNSEDIWATYGSAEGAFARGDFLNAAQMAPVGSELKGCALILGGLQEQGLAILDRHTPLGGRSQMCRTLALWSLNRADEAVAALQGVADPEYREPAIAFETLIRRNDVTIFITGAILSVFPEHYSESFISPSYTYGSITTKYVGSQFKENAYDYDSSQPLDRFIEGLPEDQKPDILFALSPQWILPRDFHKSSVPKVIWAHDSDAFQYRNVDNFALYDVAICNCSHEHFELSQGTPGLYCAANMLLHPLATPFPEASSQSVKTYDLIFTGSAMAPFHSEKPRFLYHLAGLSEQYKVQVIDGHMPERQYFEVISHAKFLPVVNRYAGMPSPRWRDALANGAFLLYPEHTFYGEIAPGTFPFKAETMLQDIAQHFDNFDAGTSPDYDLATVVPEINARFSIHHQPREESYLRLLKYALFMGLVWPRAAAAKPSRQRRPVWLTPAVDCGLFGHDHIRQRIGRVADNIRTDDLLDELDYTNAGHLYAQMVFSFPEFAEAVRWASQADRYFAEGLKRYSESLALLFTDAHWSFFRPDPDYASAEKKFRKIIECFDTLSFDPHGADIAFAYTLHDRDQVFPCYEYADIATSELVLRHTPQLIGRKSLPHGTRDIILAACHGYLGWAALKREDTAGGLANLKRGIAIFPHGLPMLRLYFDTLLRQAADVGKRTPALASDLATAFIAVVNANPSILMTHVYTIVPILADNGEREAAREVAAGWYRLANIVHNLRTDDEKHQLALLSILWHYRSFLPDRLLDRVEEGLRDEQAMQDPTQLELRFIQVARAFAVARKQRGFWPWSHSTTVQAEDEQAAKNLTPLERRLVEVARISLTEEKRWGFLSWPTRHRTPTAVERLLAESGYGRERIFLSKIRRAASLWASAPPDVRSVYLNKTWRMIRRGGVRQTFRRMQKWGTESRWSTAALVAQPSRKRWRTRLQERLKWFSIGPRRRS